MTNHREHIKVKIALCVHKKCVEKHPESLDSALYDWRILGIFHGFCLYKWNKTDQTTPLTRLDDLLATLVFTDMQFQGPQCHTMPQS